MKSLLEGVICLTTLAQAAPALLTESTFYYSIHSGEDIYDSHSVVKFILTIETIKCL